MNTAHSAQQTARSTQHTARRRGTRSDRVEFDPTDIFSALNAAHVQYLVVGGIAAIYHGVPRTTLDVDLAVRLEVDNLRRLARVMKRLGFEPRVPADVTQLADSRTRWQWTHRKAMKVFSFIERTLPFRVVDVMVNPLKNFSQLYRQRVKVMHRGVKLPLVPLRELIRMKTGTGRLRDQEDVQYLRFADSVGTYEAT